MHQPLFFSDYMVFTGKKTAAALVAIPQFKQVCGIKLLESPIPAAAAAPAAPSQKAHCDNISGTKRGTIDPLVSKRPEKILNKKIQN